MAKDGRYAHAVPVRATSQANRQGVGHLLTSRVAAGLFVVSVTLTFLAIIVAAPQNAGPSARGAIPGLVARSPDPVIAVQRLMSANLPGRISLLPGVDGAAGNPEGSGGGGTAGAREDGGGETAGAREDGGGETASRPPGKLRGYRWPITNGQLTGYYDYRDTGFLVVGGRRIHEGMDIASPCGSPVRAAHAGEVLAAGRDFARHTGFSEPLDDFYRRLRQQDRMRAMPLAVVVDDGNGYRSVYAHLESSAVKRGDRVKAGQVIGHQGATGNATGCHLHYELIRMDGPWMRVAAERVREDGYPRWVRERVDPLEVLSLSDPRAPRLVPSIQPPRDPPRLSREVGPDR